MVVNPVSKLVAKPVLVESTEGGARPWYFGLVACFFSKPVAVVYAVVEPVAVAAVAAAAVPVAVVPVAVVPVAAAAEPVAAVAEPAAEPVVSVAVRGPLKTVCEEPDPE
jgi:hypothetical protein